MVVEYLRDNIHSHFCHTKRPMAISFLNPHPPYSKRPFRNGKIFQRFEGPVFGEYRPLALCQYVTGVGFPPRSSQLFFNNGRADRNIKNEINMEYVL